MDTKTRTPTRQLVRDNEYAAEVKHHLDWMNWIFAVSLFLMTLAALPFPHPWKACMFELLLIVPMYIYAFTSFPPTLVAVRQLCKDDPADTELHALRTHLEKKFHGWKAVFTVSPLWLALIFYLVVFASGLSARNWLTNIASWIRT